MSGLTFTTPKRVKRSDQIVAAIKRWIVVQGKQPGDRLPNEKELMEQFSSAKGTVREALKSLEVQGLVSIRTGPNGGAVIEQVPYERASDLLRSFLHFQQPSGTEIYGLRTLIEPEITALAALNLNEQDLQELEALVDCCRSEPATFDERMTQRMAELEFHIVLAKRCGNPMLEFIGRFVNDMIRDLVIFKKSALPEQRGFSCSNLHFHEQLLTALRQRDAVQAREIMAEHMKAAEHFNQELEGQLKQHFLAAPEQA